MYVPARLVETSKTSKTSLRFFDDLLRKNSFYRCDAAEADVVDVFLIGRWAEVESKGSVIHAMLPITTADEAVLSGIRVETGATVVIDPSDTIPRVPSRIRRSEGVVTHR